jgi:hypothetical protein
MEPDSSVTLSEKNRNGPAYSQSVSGESGKVGKIRGMAMADR